MDDFDFIIGRWRVHHRKLRDTGDPHCTEWVEFESRSEAVPVLGGFGHVDRIFTEGEHGFEGLTLRQFDPRAGVWRIWWASSRNPGHVDPPLEGVWRDGVGTFHGDDVLGGRPVRLRFEWTTDGPDSARWRQFFSFDDGAGWRHNWTMTFTRDEG